MRSLSNKVPARRWLIVVADDQATLRQGLRLTFANDPSVEVVLDRRAPNPRSRLMSYLAAAASPITRARRNVA